MYPWNLNGKNTTSSDSPDFVFVTQKLKVASPSVTKETRESASSSVKTEAWTTDFRKNSCSRPSHPLGCESMRSILHPRLSHNIFPMGSLSWMKVFAESNRYRMKSAKMSWIDLPLGKSGVTHFFATAGNSPGESFNFHLRSC